MSTPTSVFTFHSPLGVIASPALAQVAGAPGGGGGQPAQQAAPQGGGGSAPSGGGGGGSMMTLLMPILIFVAFYFFLIRPQQKKAKDLESKLKRGDRVFTNGGVIGKIVTLGDKRATLEIAPGVKVEILRTSIGGIDEGDEVASKKDEKGDKAEKAEKVAEAKK
jgi:preprotein translocase subunit YajC